MSQDEHGGDLAAHPGVRLDFSVNLNPLGLPPVVHQAISDNLATLARYPDPQCRELRQALADHHGVDANQILCGNGASDLIYRVCQASRPRRVLLASPTFSEYERSARAAGAQVVHQPLTPESGFSLGEAFVDAITADIDLVFICQPNNPTGRLVAPVWLDQIVERTRQVAARLVVDECFLDFTTAGSLIPLIQAQPHLLVVRALTKSHSLAAYRLGYAIGDPALLAALADHGPRWSVSALAQLAGLAALTDTGWLERSRRVVAEERRWLEAELGRLGLDVVPSDANYLLFRSTRALFGPLLARGILIRSCANFPGLDASWWRVGLKTRDENRQLVAAIQEVVYADPGVCT